MTDASDTEGNKSRSARRRRRRSVRDDTGTVAETAGVAATAARRSAAATTGEGVRRAASGAKAKVERVEVAVISPAEMAAMSSATAKPSSTSTAPKLPPEFAYDSEHPVLPIPVTVFFKDKRLVGEGVSIAAVYVEPAGTEGWRGQRGLAQLRFDFEGFTVQFSVEVLVCDITESGSLQLQFTDPTGPHLPQLRNIVNSYLSGDMITVGSLLSYSGPTKPKAPKGKEETPIIHRLRGYGMAVLSLALLAGAVYLMAMRATSHVELRPVLVTRAGQDMRATTAGQLSYLNPDAANGEVIFSINSVSGDVLNFQLQCDCEVMVAEGMFQGATVLAEDSIVTTFDSSAGIVARTLISIEGLTEVMSGAKAYLDLTDGRSLDVEVKTTSATDSAVQRGEEFVPVELEVVGGELESTDDGLRGRLRLVTPIASFIPQFTKG